MKESRAMSEPFDLDAVIAEAGEPVRFEFTFGGEAFHMPAAADIDVVMVEQIEGASEGSTMRTLLGDDQWERLVALRAAGHRLSGRHLAALLEAWQAHVGVELGE
jgi:hypothetical protein